MSVTRSASGEGRMPSFEPRKNETVNGVTHPVGPLNGRWGRADGRDEGPVPGGLWDLVRGRFPAFINPAGEQGNLRFGQRRLLVRHPRKVVARALDSLNDETLRAVAGPEAGAGFAAFQQEDRRVEPQPALLLGRTVTPVTVLGEDRLDLPRNPRPRPCRSPRVRAAANKVAGHRLLPCLAIITMMLAAHTSLVKTAPQKVYCQNLQGRPAHRGM